ncbi:RNA ligase (ATP) [Streptomyces noursei]|uniref:RNA ligase (ATP) n=1 Tax=Streptomyces noursei TaxID=1971 RepID=UPI00382E9459
MSTLLVTVEELTVHEHPNADALELAQVGLYRAVVAKGAYRTGEFAVCIPEQAVLPEALMAERGLTGKLAGAANRVKAIRLRGELSQGIARRPRALSGVDLADAHKAGVDFAAELGIVKWVPPVPISMSEEAEPASDLLPWIDVENLKRYPAAFADGEPVAVAEKVHGTACCLTYHAGDDRVQMTSKALGAQRLALVEDPGNLYWRAVRGHRLPRVAAESAGELGATRVGIYGEVYGDGVQDLGDGTDSRRDVPGYAVFDLAVEVGTRDRAGPRRPRTAPAVRQRINCRRVRGSPRVPPGAPGGAGRGRAWPAGRGWGRGLRCGGWGAVRRWRRRCRTPGRGRSPQLAGRPGWRPAAGR